ncbi:hypothetical protein SB763_35625, partial [Burkholderia sp. SIMBA_042]|uniref:hypothetical protein n=1 Tax=Burkholderia sp. SIMBA_042 TaxID=3085783 RepID=UPI00397BBBDE
DGFDLAIRSEVGKDERLVARPLLGLAGCDTPPRDTSSTPPPPREPIAASDDVYPPPSTVHDTRPKRTTP